MTKLRMAQYGAKHGHAGGKLLSMRNHPEVEVVGVYEPDVARRAAAEASEPQAYGGVRWFDDSKATSPHAAGVAIRSFDSVVLIAGGRNKDLDLSAMAADVARIRAVVVIGDAAEELAGVFDGKVPVRRATSMSAAVEHAAAVAKSGDVVLLSPGCTSYDWYSNYGERGDDFQRNVKKLLGSWRPLAWLARKGRK